MPARTRPLRYAAATALLLALVACNDSDGDEPGTSPTPATSSSATATTTSPSTSPSASPSDETRPSGGPADAPTALTPHTDLLDWQPVAGSVDDVVTRNGRWTLTVRDDGDGATLAGPGSRARTSAPGWRVSDALLDDDWAVVVLQDKAEQRPSRAAVTDLETGKAFEINARSDVPTTNGGTWALGGGRLLHATIHGGAYCLASVDLADQTSEVLWCAPQRTGFNAAHVTPAGDTLLTFDDSRPSCRTVVTIASGDAVPFPGTTECKAWEGVALDDGAVWSTIPRERRIEEAHVYARVGDGYFDLGPSTAGGLVWCDGATYFTRDPQRQGDAAALMRWSPDAGLSVVYESPKGQAFVDAPRCGGATMTITALTSSGDEQVTAAL